MKSDVRIDGNRLRIVRVFQAPRPQVFSQGAAESFEKLDALAASEVPAK